MERLRPQADAIDAVIGQNAHLVGVERIGVGLQGKLMAGLEWQPAEQGVKQPFQLGGAEVTRRAAAEEESVHRLRAAQCRDLGD